MSPFLALALALLAAPAGDAPAWGRLQVQQGRASLAAPEGVEVLAPGEARNVAGRGYLEVSPRGRVELRWDRAGSLVLSGPAALEWSPSASGRTELRLLGFQSVHVELRRGPLLLALPGGWRAVLESGACYLDASPAGLEVHHDAGRPLLLLRPEAAGNVLPPLTLLPGARVRLAGALWSELGLAPGRALDPFARRDHGREAEERRAEPWGGFSWPWSPSATAVARAPVAGAW